MSWKGQDPALVLRSGKRAWYRGLGGVLVRVRVLAIEGESGPAGAQSVRFEVTARQPGYERGRVIEAHARHLTPISASRKFGNKLQLRTDIKVEADCSHG